MADKKAGTSRKAPKKKAKLRSTTKSGDDPREVKEKEKQYVQIKGLKPPEQHKETSQRSRRGSKGNKQKSVDDKKEAMMAESRKGSGKTMKKKGNKTKRSTEEKKKEKEPNKSGKEDVKKDNKEAKENKENKDSKDAREAKEPKENKENKDAKENKEAKDNKESGRDGQYVPLASTVTKSPSGTATSQREKKKAATARGGQYAKLDIPANSPLLNVSLTQDSLEKAVSPGAEGHENIPRKSRDKSMEMTVFECVDAPMNPAVAQERAPGTRLSPSIFNVRPRPSLHEFYLSKNGAYFNTVLQRYLPGWRLLKRKRVRFTCRQPSIKPSLLLHLCVCTPE
ncbi:unnamed protein product, partial [Mesorhabditis spiculigera]